MLTQRKVFLFLWSLMCLCVLPAYAEFLPASGQLLLHFDMTGGKGSLLFDDSTGSVSIVPTVVTEAFIGQSKLPGDSIVGITVTGSGTFVGDGGLFPSIEVSDFSLVFTHGPDVILRIAHATPVFPELFSGTTNEAFDFGPLTVATQDSLPGSDFLSNIVSLNSDGVKWKGGFSYKQDETGNWVMHDAVAAFPLPEPGALGLVAAGLATLWIGRRHRLNKCHVT